MRPKYPFDWPLEGHRRFEQKVPVPVRPVLRRAVEKRFKPLGATERLVAVLNDYGGSSFSYPRGRLTDEISVRRIEARSDALPLRVEGYDSLDLLVVESI